MAELTIDLKPEDVHAAIQQALVQALKPEVCDKLVREAVQKLLAGDWTRPSDMQRIFNLAVGDVARKVAEEEMAKPENVEKVRQVVAEAWEKAFDKTNREKLLERVADAITTAMVGKGY